MESFKNIQDLEWSGFICRKKGSIIIWNSKTLRFISQSTYKILPRNNIPYDWKLLDPANFIRNKPENEIIHDDLITKKVEVDRFNNDTNTKIEKSSTEDVVNKRQLLD